MKLRRSNDDLLLRPSAAACLLLVGLACGGAACQMIAGIRDVTRAAGGAGGTGGEGGKGGAGGAGGKGGAGGGGPSCVPTAPLDPPDCSTLFSDETKVLSIAHELKASYTCVDIGWLGGLGDPNMFYPTRGILIPKDAPDTLLVVKDVGEMEGQAALYRIPLLRDQACHIAGIGMAEKIADLEHVDGITRDPGGALLFGRSNSPSTEQAPIVAGLARMKVGSNAPDELLDLTLPEFGVNQPVSGVGFVPSGFLGAGKLVFTTSRTDFVSPPVSKWFSVNLAGDGTGPLEDEVLGVTEEANLDGPASFAFLHAGSLGFPTDTVLISDYRQRGIFAYTMTMTGAPDSQSKRTVVQIPKEAGISQTDVGPWGIALDPVSGDLLVVLREFQELVAIRGFSP